MNSLVYEPIFKVHLANLLALDDRLEQGGAGPAAFTRPLGEELWHHCRYVIYLSPIVTRNSY